MRPSIHLWRNSNPQREYHFTQCVTLTGKSEEQKVGYFLIWSEDDGNEFVMVRKSGTWLPTAERSLAPSGRFLELPVSKEQF